MRRPGRSSHSFNAALRAAPFPIPLIVKLSTGSHVAHVDAPAVVLAAIGPFLSGSR